MDEHTADAHLRCRDDLALSVLTAASLLLTVWWCVGPPSDDVERFLLGALALPALSVWWGRVPLWQRLLRGVLAGGAWVYGYGLFVGYQDHPWLAGPETNACDGPCFGWYTFEFTPPYGALVCVVVVGLALGLSARGVLWRSQRERSILDS